MVWYYHAGKPLYWCRSLALNAAVKFRRDTGHLTSFLEYVPFVSFRMWSLPKPWHCLRRIVDFYHTSLGKTFIMAPVDTYSAVSSSVGSRYELSYKIKPSSGGFGVFKVRCSSAHPWLGTVCAEILRIPGMLLAVAFFFLTLLFLGYSNDTKAAWTVPVLCSTQLLVSFPWTRYRTEVNIVTLWHQAKSLLGFHVLESSNCNITGSSA